MSGEETEDYAARSNGRLESELKEAIESMIGKEVRVRFGAPDEKGGQAYTAEEILQSRIPMDMEIEEEEGQKGENY